MMKNRIISLLMSAFMFVYGAVGVAASEAETTAPETTAADLSAVSEETTAADTTVPSEETTATETASVSTETVAVASESKNDSEANGSQNGESSKVEGKGTVSISAVVTNPTADGALSGVFKFVVESEAPTATADCVVYRNGQVIAEMNEVQLPLELELSYDAVAVVELKAGTYYISQYKNDGYITSGMERTVNITDGSDKELEFENRFVTGTGFIELGVSVADGVQVQSTDIVSVTLRADDGDTVEADYTVYDESDNVVDSGVLMLPDSVELAFGQYAVVETNVGSYTAVYEKTEHLTPDVSTKMVSVSEGKTATVMSRYQYKAAVGEVTVSVTVDKADGVTIPAETRFSFTVTNEDESGKGLCNIYSSDGELKSTVDLNLPATFTMGFGDYATLELPEGDYTVVQNPVDDFTVQTSQNVTIIKNQTAELDFENKYIEPMGILEVGVQVDYPVGPKKPVGDVFVFEISGKINGNSVEYTVYNADGTVNGAGVSVFPMELELEDSMYAHITLPANREYTVTMAEHKDYIAESETERVTVRKGKVSDVVFKSLYIEPVGQLLLDVDVIDDRYADAPDDVFRFVLDGETYRTEIEYSVYNSNFEKLGSYVADYSAILEINRDQYMLIELTPGDYTVTQLGIDDYIITDKIAVTVEKGAECEAVFENRYVEPLGKIVIERDGLGENESFVFNVVGTDRTNRSVSVTVILPEGTDSVTVGSLPMGAYRVEPVDEWSMRYVANATVDLVSSDYSTVELELLKNGDVMNVEYEFVYSDKLHWLLGEAYFEKRYIND